MKTKITTLLFGLILTPCVCLAKGAPDVVDSFQQQLDALLNAVVICPPGAPTRFVDNGDGTICDHENGLMWEKKNAADGVEDLDNPHDVDNLYTLSSNIDSVALDGTAFTDFLPWLNGEIHKFRAPFVVQLGGYSDWRVPTRGELRTLLLEPPPCSITPCIDPFFTPSGPSGYWSSTGFTNDPSIPQSDKGGFSLNFNLGTEFGQGRSSPKHVRAVRGSMGGR